MLNIRQVWIELSFPQNLYDLMANWTVFQGKKNKGLQDDFSLKPLYVSGSEILSNQIVEDFINFACLERNNTS